MFYSTNILRIARSLISIVLLINLQSAVAFISDPSRYAPAYELSGIPGKVAIQGFGILFVMWNVPYVFAIIHPIKNRISLYESVVMQGLGLAGESFILWRLPPGHINLAQSIQKFIFFDGGGLLALLIAVVITHSQKFNRFFYRSENRQ